MYPGNKATRTVKLGDQKGTNSTPVREKERGELGGKRKGGIAVVELENVRIQLHPAEATRS